MVYQLVMSISLPPALNFLACVPVRVCACACVCVPQSKHVSSSVLAVGKQRRGLMSGVNGQKERGTGALVEG